MSASHGNRAPQGLLRSVSPFLRTCPDVLVTCTTDRIREAPGERYNECSTHGIAWQGIHSPPAPLRQQVSSYPLYPPQVKLATGLSSTCITLRALI